MRARKKLNGVLRKVFQDANRAMIEGNFLGALIRNCLFIFMRPKTTTISDVETSNSLAKNLTIWSVALPARGACVTLILS